MANLQKIKQVSAQLHLNLDNPQSVRQQLKRINQARKELQRLKQEVNRELQELKQPEQKWGLDEVAAIGLHIFGEHRVAQQVTRVGNRMERQQRRKVQQARKPHVKMRDLIDNYLFEGDRLHQMAKTYLQENK